MRSICKKLILISLLFLFVATLAVAADSETIPAEKVSVKTVLNAISSYYETDIDKYGQINISDDDYNYYIEIDKEKKMIRLQYYVLGSPYADRDYAIRIINDWNTNRVIAKAFTHIEDENIYFELYYEMLYTGGVNIANLNETIDWFFILLEDYGETLYYEDLI